VATAGGFILQRAFIARQVFNGSLCEETAKILKKQKREYRAFLLRSQAPKIAEKNANRVFDALIDYCY
jgi:hypothetical protein